MKQDSRAIFTAAAHAQRAADYLNNAASMAEAVAA
jgi:antirestriction protein ArdC